MLKRTAIVFLCGIFAPIAGFALFLVTAAVFLVSLGIGVVGLWSIVMGVLWLMTHDHRMGVDAWQAARVACIGFGGLMAAFSLFGDGFMAARRKLARPRLVLEQRDVGFGG